MYIKVYYVKENGKLRDATIADVQAALPDDMPGLTVDEIVGSCTIVKFPDGAKYQESYKLAKHLQGLGFETEYEMCSMFDQTFIDEIEQLALQIAKLQRNEDHLQDINTIFDKLYREYEELEQADNIWDEIPDIVYYSTCAYIQGWPYRLRAMPRRLKMDGITVEQAKAATLAKYRLRAAGNPKNIEVERAAIMAAIEGKE